MPGYFNVGVTLLALLIIIPLALQASHEPPPAVAEFAPQVQEQIKQAPQQQSSQFGRGGEGAGGAGALGASPSPSGGSAASPSPSGPDVPLQLVKHCVGNPPRQTEDPQSPPCVAYYPPDKDNGGATWQGVTKDAIYIGIPNECGQGGGDNQWYNDLETYFNNRFQTYNRKVKFICGQAGIGEAPQANQEADADNLAKNTTNPLFASTHYRNADGFYYSRRMACTDHVLTVAGGYFPMGQTYMNQCPGMLWQYVMDADTEFQQEGQWICDRLAGKNAMHSPGSDATTVPAKPFSSEVRKFGIIFQPYDPDDPTTPDPLRNQLKVCNVQIPNRDVLMNPITNPSSAPGAPVDPSSANNAMLQMKNDGVSSVICLCNLFSFGALQKAASGQSYTPEWIASTYGPNDMLGAYQLGGDTSSDQLANTFGVSFVPRAIRLEEEPWWMAVKEVDPTASFSNVSTQVENMQENYRPLLVLMSGIQMAGPNLTPQTFAAGLRRAVFPNPDTSTFAGHVGFSGSTYSMTIDGAEWWYSANDAGPYSDSNRGVICYVGNGLRHPAGQWPASGDPFFKPNPCNGLD